MSGEQEDNRTLAMSGLERLKRCAPLRLSSSMVKVRPRGLAWEIRASKGRREGPREGLWIAGCRLGQAGLKGKLGAALVPLPYLSRMASDCHWKAGSWFRTL